MVENSIAPVEDREPRFRRVGPDQLPIFRFDVRGDSVFYVPGVHPATIVSSLQGDLLEASLCTEAEASGRWAAARHDLLEAAHRVLRVHEARLEHRFEPECLTILATNVCNLGCSYCHTSAGSSPASVVPLEAVRTAAKLVAANCRRKAVPLTVVFHGGGEPTLFTSVWESALLDTRRVAAGFDVRCFAYIATNGVMSERKAQAVGRAFDLVGISCDGPEDVHERQRPALDARPTLATIERNARVMREQGCALCIRATVTRSTVHRLPELVDYFALRFAPVRISFEPLYRTGRAVHSLAQPPEAGEFVKQLLAAHRRASALGIELEFPDCRPQELHGPFCHFYRDVLSITPDGRITACFDVTEATRPNSEPYLIGHWDAMRQQLQFDNDRLRALQRTMTVEDPECGACFNRFHCARGCPEICPVQGEPKVAGTERCRMALLWAYHRILPDNVAPQSASVATHSSEAPSRALTRWQPTEQ